MGEAAGGLAGELVPGVVLRDPGGAEDRHPLLDVAQLVEGGVDLLADAVEALLVVGLDVAGNAE